MKRAEKIEISRRDVMTAVMECCKGHRHQREVRRMEADRERVCDLLYEAIQKRDITMHVGFRHLVKTNTNGKVRHISQPRLYTRVLEHVLVNAYRPLYAAKDNNTAHNCKKGHGLIPPVTGQYDRRDYTLPVLKHWYYDERQLTHVLTMDMRKCYEHVTRGRMRQCLKLLSSDTAMNDLFVDVSFDGDLFPIGTPSSPFLHHVWLLRFDLFAKTLSRHYTRYADNVLLAFDSKQEAQRAKWRIQQWWWYEMGVRSKTTEQHIVPMWKPLDFCGYVYHRNADKRWNSHDKGYVSVRRDTYARMRRCRGVRSYASYFGLVCHADLYGELEKKEQEMRLSELTGRIKIDRGRFDAETIEMKSLLGEVFKVLDYEVRYDSRHCANWCRLLVSYPRKEDGTEVFGEVHGGYAGIAEWLDTADAMLRTHGQSLRGCLPLEDCEIINHSGYIFVDSSNAMRSEAEYNERYGVH